MNGEDVEHLQSSSDSAMEDELEWNENGEIVIKRRKKKGPRGKAGGSTTRSKTGSLPSEKKKDTPK